ncbi:MAG: NAD(P)-dependent oxidoreductase [Planctomycetota bacterium]
MKTVALTGASGAIGKAIAEGLPGLGDYELRPMSRSINGTDLMEADGLAEKFRGCDAVIHLAWGYARESEVPGRSSFNNLVMHRNVLDATKAAGVKQAVMASSVHADFFYDWMGPGLLGLDRQQRANGLYGGLKLLVETLDEEAADEDYRVVDVRYGGVTDDGQPHPTDSWERRVWLSYADLCRLMHAVLAHDDPPAYAKLYAVSDNEHRVHDTANPFGWEPQDSAPVDIRADLSP